MYIFSPDNKENIEKNLDILDIYVILTLHFYLQKTIELRKVSILGNFFLGNENKLILRRHSVMSSSRKFHKIQGYIMGKFTTDGRDLYIDVKKVLCGWESFNGWYWFATELAYKQDTLFDGYLYKDDTIWFGYIQGLEDGWGYFSQAEIEQLIPNVWKISKKDLPFSGHRN